MRLPVWRRRTVARGYGEGGHWLVALWTELKEKKMQITPKGDFGGVFEPKILFRLRDVTSKCVRQ